MRNQRPPPAQPTAAPSGSAEKAEELARRAERGQALWRSEDCTSGPTAGRRSPRDVAGRLQGGHRVAGGWEVRFRRGNHTVYVGLFRWCGEAAQALRRTKEQTDPPAG